MSFRFKPVQCYPRIILIDSILVDKKDKIFYPDNFEVNHYPVIVKADGDCLPACGSVYLY